MPVVNGFGGSTFYEGPTAYGNFGDWFSCGPYALGACLYAAVGQPFTGPDHNTIVNRMLANGTLNHGGSSLSGLAAYARQYFPQIHQSYGGGDLLAAIQNALTGGNMCVVVCSQAHNLLHNEPGVFDHFYAIGGIDGNGNVYIQNGDRAPMNQPNGPYWAPLRGGIGSVQSSAVGGVLIFARGPGVGTSGSPTTLPSGGTGPDSTQIADTISPLAPQQGLILGGAGILLNAATEPFLATAAASRTVLNQLPGIEGIAYTLDAVEQFPGIDNSFDIANPIGSAVRSVLATIMGNSEALFIRAGLVIVGLGLFTLLMISLILVNMGSQAEKALPLLAEAGAMGA